MVDSENVVLVTGASGFLAMHCILRLIEKGYKVRGTLRTPSREANLHKTLKNHIDTYDPIEFFSAELMNDEGWEAACKGCKYILHIASPFPSQPPQNEDDLIRPAREGTIRVLNAAVSNNVKRVVMTSSIAAVVYDNDQDETKIYSESDWSRTDQDIGAYEKSKTFAERAAWDFIDSLQGDDVLELAVINPGLILGPILDNDYSTSGEVIRKLMRREYPGCPNLNWPPVDVRDVADAHIAAMEIPDAAGKRFCCTIEPTSMQDIAMILNEHFASRGFKVPTRKLPNILIRFFALFDKTIRLIVKDLDKDIKISNDQIIQVLNWKPRSIDEMVVAMGESMIEHRVV